MQDSSQEWERIRAPSSTVQRLMRTPSSTTTPAPIVTLGPMTQFAPILALGSWKEEGLCQGWEGRQLLAQPILLGQPGKRKGTA